VSTLLKSATLVDLEPACVEVADLRISGGVITARAPSLEPTPDDEVIDLSGRLLLPGFVSAYHRLTTTALRGLKRRAANGVPSEVATRDALEDALTLDDVEVLSAAAALEGLSTGTTCVFDAHASPRAITGSLTRVARGLGGAGLRAVLACEVGERHGAVAREEALSENAAYAQLARGRYRGAFALAGLDTLSADALTGLAGARKDELVLASIAEYRGEEARSVELHGKTPAERLLEAGLVGARVVLARNVHLSWPDLSQLISAGTWMALASRTNMSSQAGQPAPGKFGVRGCFGTDAASLDVLLEAQVATLRSLDVGQPIDLLRFLANGHRLASEAFGLTIGPLREGATADLVVWDYHAPTPFDASTLGAHLLYGLSSRDVESVMVDGLWRMWKRKPLSLDVGDSGRAAREATAAVWARLPA
jgi:cytosine/adenosine deaminase-related metal-dependent hydrolase